MSAAAAVTGGLHFSPSKPVSETPDILGPGENRMRNPEEEKKMKKIVVSANAAKKLDTHQIQRQSTKIVVVGVGTKKEEDTSSECCSVDGTAPVVAVVVGQGMSVSSKKKKVRNGVQNGAKVVPLVGGIQILTPPPVPFQRCYWITPHSDPMYTKFHDEEWGVPVYDEIKLFELFVLSQALSELTWPAILHNRNTFRIMFDNFDPSSVASFDEKKLQSMVKRNFLLSEPKLLAIVENAKQVLKTRQEFGSFSNYCWNFVKHKPIRNGFKYARQVPAKTPKSELLSKDLMRRGFQRVGPTVVYSFMQVSGMVNDHLLSCFRYTMCSNDDNNNNNDNDDDNSDKKIENMDLSVKANA